MDSIFKSEEARRSVIDRLLELARAEGLRRAQVDAVAAEAAQYYRAIDRLGILPITVASVALGTQLMGTMWDVWLDPTNHNVDMLSGLLVPARDDLLTMHAVSTDVNNVRNKGIELIDSTSLLQPLLAVIPLQLLAYYIARGRGLNVPVLSDADLESFAAEHAIKLAILCVPAEQAQSVHETRESHALKLLSQLLLGG